MVTEIETRAYYATLPTETLELLREAFLLDAQGRQLRGRHDVLLPEGRDHRERAARARGVGEA